MNLPLSIPGSDPAPAGVPAALLASPDLHQHILSSVSDGIHVIDLHGRVLVENDASARMLGWRGDCLVGKLGHTAIHHHHADGSDFPIEDCPIFAAVHDGRARDVTDDVFWRQDGSSFPVEYSVAPLCDADGVRYGVTVVFRDITERKRAALMQATLFAISECAHDCETPAALFPQLHRIIDAILPAAHLHVALREGAGVESDFAYSADIAGAPAPARAAIAARLAAGIIGAGQSILADACGEPPEPRTGHWLGVPLRADHEVIGALVVHQSDAARSYTEADRDLLQFVATQVATAIERVRRDATLRHMAQFDALTDLPNRQLFNDRLDAALCQARRRGEPLALLFVDLDHFKPVNDTHGHAIGDALLVAVADRVRRLLRASDTVGRVGGDEFVIVLHPITSEPDALLVAEKIRSALEAPFDLGDASVRISASIGLATWPRHGDDRTRLSHAADDAMYRAKRQGGNRVCVAD